MCLWHYSGCDDDDDTDANAQFPCGASVVKEFFRMLASPDKELGSDTAVRLRSPRPGWWRCEGCTGELCQGWVVAQGVVGCSRGAGVDRTAPGVTAMFEVRNFRANQKECFDFPVRGEGDISEERPIILRNSLYVLFSYNLA
jgi:hypothetical protein